MKKGVIKMKECRYCLSTENLTVDHKIPKIQGGTNELKNLQCLCRTCNQIKSALSHNQVRRLFNWLRHINNERAKHDKKPY